MIMDLFKGVIKLAVEPFFNRLDERGVTGRKDDAEWQVGEIRDSWLKCADEHTLKSARPW